MSDEWKLLLLPITWLLTVVVLSVALVCYAIFWLPYLLWTLPWRADR